MFAKGTEAIEVVKGSGNFTKWYGIAPVSVLAINPTKQELEKIYNNTQEKDPQYLYENKRDNGDIDKSFRVSVVVKDELKNFITSLNFFLAEKDYISSDGNKVQVMDKYGRTAWVTKDELAKKDIPQYANGPAKLDKEYFPIKRGQADLVNFIRAYLCIPNVDKFSNGSWVEDPNPSKCEGCLTDVSNYFKGNIKEITNAIKLQPKNLIQVMFGVEERDGKLYQVAFMDYFAPATYIGPEKSFQRALDKINTRYPKKYQDCTFSTEPLQEYVAKPSVFTDSPAVAPTFVENSTDESLPF